MKIRRRPIRPDLLCLPIDLPIATSPMGLMTESYPAEPDPPWRPPFYAQTSTPESVHTEISRECEKP